MSVLPRMARLSFARMITKSHDVIDVPSKCAEFGERLIKLANQDDSLRSVENDEFGTWKGCMF